MLFRSVEPSDIVLKFDGKAVQNSGDLPRLVGGTKPGTRATIQVWRKGQARDLVVVVGELPEEAVARGEERRNRAPDIIGRLGLTLSELSAEQKRDPRLAHGVVVDEVRGPLRGDLRPADVIVAIFLRGASVEIKSVEHLARLLASQDKGTNVTLLVRRKDGQVFVSIRIPG